MASLLSAFTTPTPPPAAPVTPATHGTPDSDQQWPHEAVKYTLLRLIGRGAFASVYSAVVHCPDGTIPSEPPKSAPAGYLFPYCAIKIIELENVNSSIDDIRQEVLIMRTVKHPNTLDCYASFIHNQQMWLVTQIMAQGSCLHALNCLPSKNLPAGFPESSVSYVLHQTLLGLEYFHKAGHIHRDVKAGNILLGSLGGVRLADFGVSGWLVNSADRRKNTKTFVGTPCWMAPEVMEQIDGYDYSADIWSLGITALELAKGHAPYAHFPPMKVLLLTIQEDPPSLDTYEFSSSSSTTNSLSFSRAFESFVKACLQKDPSKRPTAEELLQHKLFSGFDKPEKVAAMRATFCKEVLASVDGICEKGRELRTDEKGGGGDNGEDSEQYVTFSIEKGVNDRPAGTTWVFGDGSQEIRKGGKAEGDDGKDGKDFFEEFEKKTGGENFVKGGAEKEASKEEEVVVVPEAVVEKEENDSFMDDFEKLTSGENAKKYS